MINTFRGLELTAEQCITETKLKRTKDREQTTDKDG